jgi:hypothetical protein
MAESTVVDNPLQKKEGNTLIDSFFTKRKPAGWRTSWGFASDTFK